MSHLGGHLGLSEALLEPSWPKKYPLTPREPPRPGPGEGVGGGVKLASSSESSMACPFPPALPQHKKQCCHNLGPKSHPISQRVCAPSHSCHAFCDVDDKTSMLKRETLMSYCFFTGRMGPPEWSNYQSVRPVPLLPCILLRGKQNVHVETKNVDFILFFHR